MAENNGFFEDEGWMDEDIRAMSLSFFEKSGLQVYRNYTKAFRENSIKKFKEALDAEVLDISAFVRFSEKIVTEDVRYLPVIVCAYADDLLTDAFNKTLPDEIPGGRKAMFGAHGPLSSFSQKIRLAYAFDVISVDILKELNRVRSVRNKLAHSWDVSDLEAFYHTGELSQVEPIEDLIATATDDAGRYATLGPVERFRIRMIWISGRLVYEVAANSKVRLAMLPRASALYGNSSTKWLREISKQAMACTRQVVGTKNEGGGEGE